MRLVIGLDIGTTSTIAVLMDETGNVLTTASRPTVLSSPHPGFAEEDPGEWWRNACAVLVEVAAAVPAGATLEGLCTTGMLPAVVLLGGDGAVLRPSIQQSDARCAIEVAELKASIDEDDFLQRTGQGLTQQLVAPKLRWLETHEPCIFADIATVFGSYDYINWRLTGERAVERNWALEAGFVDLATGEIADDLVALAGINRPILPSLIAAHERVGAVTTEASSLTGLPQGLPVFGGAADHIASALAAGLTKPGDVLLKFGGAGDVVAVTERAAPDRRLFLDYHLVPGLYAPNGCMASSGSALRWLAGLIGRDPSDGGLASLDRLAAMVPPGSDGVRALPYFLGEKTPIHDPRARGTFTGLSLGHGPGHLWRAELEAIACGFRHHLEVLADMGQPANRLFASDGGSSSRIWMQIVADICGLPLHLLGDSHGSAVGAGWVAIVGLGLADWSAITGSTGDVIHPIARNARVYDAVYRDYRDLYTALHPYFHRTSAP